MLQITIIKCPHFNGNGCNHIDAGVGSPVVFDDPPCGYCMKTFPDPSTRHRSRPVKHWIYKERRLRGLPADHPEPKAKKTKVQYKHPNCCEHLGKAVSRQSCNCPKKHTYECTKLKDDRGGNLLVVPAINCESCGDYEDSEL